MATIEDPFKWEKLPWWVGGSAYRLLQVVCEIVTQEPKRMVMPATVQRARTYNSWGKKLNRGPACGTQGCVAGWMYLVTVPVQERVFSGNVIGDALRMLPQEKGIQREAWNLFHGRGRYPFPEDSQLREGTPKYAEAVVTNIKRFMRKHSRALRAHTVTVPLRQDWAPLAKAMAVGKVGLNPKDLTKKAGKLHAG